MQPEAENITVDWSDCSLVEVNPRKVSGAPILKGTRVQADSIVQNYEGGESVEEIAYNFSIPESAVRELVAYAASRIATRH
jgi:uncharacterized protein (DUF433 family)